MHQVTVTQKALGECVPSIGGIGGYALQDDVTVITTHTGATIRVIGTRSDMSGVDVTPDAPRGDHDAIVAFWTAEATRWAAAAARLADPSTLPAEDGFVQAPGFTVATFTAGLAKARQAGYLTMRPVMGGMVRVDTGKAGSVYTVTRTGCSCRGHMGHGHCYHRAAVIACVDLYGINVCREEVLGFDLDGMPVTAAERAAHLPEAA